MSDEVDATIEDFLEAEICKYARLLRIYKRLDKAVSIGLGACSVGSLLLTSGTMGSALTGVGIPASLPLGSLACLSAIFTLVLSLTSKRITKKVKKHRDTLRLARSYQSQTPTPVICLKNYYDEKDQLRKPPTTTFSEDLTTHAP